MTPSSAPVYIGRFAPSPTGPLHRGSLVAALASWLDARAHHGTWLVRIEDIDTQRCDPAAADTILHQLACFGLLPDTKPVYQTHKNARYQQVLDHLLLRQRAYPCICTRAQILHALEHSGRPHQRHTALIYPGTCRPEHGGLPAGALPRAWRFHLPDHAQCRIDWKDRRQGMQSQQVDEVVGDFVLKRADGIWAYQLAVVVDDIDQGITDVVRGEDISDNTARQILLYQALNQSPPRYCHTPLVYMPNGEKLSKQHGAPAADTSKPLVELNLAAAVLGLPASENSTVENALQQWTGEWAKRYLE